MARPLLSNLMPIALALLWSLVCALLAFEAINWYRDEAAFLSAPPGPIEGPPESPFGICFAIAQTGVEIQFVVGVGLVLLLVGAVLLLTRRRAWAA